MEITRKEEAKVIAGVYIMGIIMGAEILFLTFSLIKEPQILGMIYEKITLPSGLHFITHFKWLFNLLILLVSFIPAGAVMFASNLFFSKIASKEKGTD